MVATDRIVCRFLAAQEDFPKEVVARIQHIVKAMGVRSLKVDVKKVPRGWKLYLAIDNSLFAMGGPIAHGSDFGSGNTWNLPNKTRSAMRALFLALAHSGTARQLGPEVEPIKMINVNALDVDGKMVEFTILGNYE